MKTLPVELDVLFNRTLIALETANKSKFAKCESWTCDDYSNFNAMPVTQTSIKNLDWKETITLTKNT